MPVPSLIAWLREDQAAFVRAAADLAGLGIAGAGTPGEGRSSGAASALGVEPRDDLRSDLHEGDCDVILLGDPGAFGTGDRADASAIVAAHERGVRVATLEPVPAGPLDLRAGRWGEVHGGRPVHELVTLVPLLRRSPVLREGEDAIEQFGHARTLLVDAFAAPGTVPLGALVFNALELIGTLFGEPDSIDAAYASPAQGTGVHALAGESLRGLSGDLTAVLRFADGRTACVRASDRTGMWARSATLIGAGGSLTITDDSLVWVGMDGGEVDESRREHADAPAVLADALRRLVDPSLPPEPVRDPELVLAMSQVALLSSRTGQAESPATIRRMVGA